MNINEILLLSNYLIGRSTSDIRELTVETFNYQIQLANWTKFKAECEDDNLDNLRPFMVYMGDPDSQGLTIDANGKATIPLNYHKTVSIVYNYFKNGSTIPRPITVMGKELFDDISGSILDSPTKWEPICHFDSTYIRFMPKSLRYANFMYIRVPATPVYDTKITNKWTQYDPAGSTQLEWDETNQIDIIMLLMKQLGVTVKREDVNKAIEAQNIKK